MGVLSYSRDHGVFCEGSQWHLIALNADFHCMGRSAFFPDICEFPHLFVQSTHPFLRGPLELKKIKLIITTEKKKKKADIPKVQESNACKVRPARRI